MSPKSSLGGSAIEMRQINYLGQCLQHPALIRLVNERLSHCEQKAVAEADFTLPEDRAIMRHLYQWTAPAAVAVIDELWDILDEALTQRVQYLLSTSSTPVAELESLADKLVLSVLDWRLEQVKQLLQEINQFSKESQSENDKEALTIYQKQLRDLPVLVLQINKARSAMSATNRRRAADADRY